MNDDNKKELLHLLINNIFDFNPYDYCTCIKILAGHLFNCQKNDDDYVLYCYNKYNGRWEKNDSLLRKYISDEFYNILYETFVIILKNDLNKYYVNTDHCKIFNKLHKLKTIYLKKQIISTYKKYDYLKNIGQ
jgi:hypothetical protein